MVMDMLPVLNLFERAKAWLTSKDRLQAEVKQLKRRLWALQAETNEALSNALLFENADLTAWLQKIASTDKGALGVELKEAKEQIKALEILRGKDRDAEKQSAATLAGVLEAWGIAAGTIANAKWKRDEKKWEIPETKAVLPKTVLEALEDWLNREK